MQLRNYNDAMWISFSLLTVVTTVIMSGGFFDETICPTVLIAAATLSIMFWHLGLTRLTFFRLQISELRRVWTRQGLTWHSCVVK